MAHRRPRPVHVFCVAVGIAGAALVCALVAVSPPETHSFLGVAFPLLAVSVILGELFPLQTQPRSGEGEVAVPTMFSFALVLGVGLLPAIAAQLAASLIQDVVARKPAWQVVF